MIELETRQAEWLELLQAYYASIGAPLPPIATIEGQDIPEPYRGLLVHYRDMTSVLERHHQGTVELRLLRARNGHGLYTREVVLVQVATGKPVEFGVIRIHLDRFDPEPRRMILEGRRPLGGILKQFGIAYISRPGPFLRFASDEAINRLLGLGGKQELFGRYNVLFDSMAQPLAEVVEVLPPTES